MAEMQPLTQQDIKALQAYLDALEELGKREPTRISSDVWDEAMKQIREGGEIPAEYRDIIGESPVKDINGNESRGFFDAAWEAWNSEVVKLNQKYAPIAKKALFAFFQFSLEKNPKNSESWDYDSVPLALQSIIDAANSPEITETRTAGEQLSIFPEDQRVSELAAEVLQALPRLQSIVPKKHLVPNSRLANTLTEGIIDTGRRAIGVSDPKAKVQVDILCDLVYEGDNVKLSGRQPFTEYDRNVYNAVTSLYVYGDNSHIVTPATVYRAMTGMTATEDPSPQQIGAVTRSIDKMRFIRATVDCTDQLQQRKLSLNGEAVTDGKIDTYLLNASAIQVQAGGRTVRAYQIDKTPVLYAYSNMLKQVLTFPASLLDIKAIDQRGNITGSRISNTESRIQVKGYLLRRIESMKGKNAIQSNIISLQSYEKGGKHHKGLYEVAGLEATATRKAQKAVRDYAEQALKYWKGCGHIKGYSLVKTGQSVSGIKIVL